MSGIEKINQEMYNALKVIVLTPEIKAWLEAHDPMALRQAWGAVHQAAKHQVDEVHKVISASREAEDVVEDADEDVVEDADEDTEPVTCPGCGFCAKLLGTLGTVTHYRCIACGMDFQA